PLTYLLHEPSRERAEVVRTHIPQVRRVLDDPPECALDLPATVQRIQYVLDAWHVRQRFRCGDYRRTHWLPLRTPPLDPGNTGIMLGGRRLAAQLRERGVEDTVVFRLVFHQVPHIRALGAPRFVVVVDRVPLVVVFQFRHSIGGNALVALVLGERVPL